MQRSFADLGRSHVRTRTDPYGPVRTRTDPYGPVRTRPLSAGAVHRERPQLSGGVRNSPVAADRPAVLVDPRTGGESIVYGGSLTCRQGDR
ncbi:hypothetical protein [Streptomyces albipurpureus]|uniref:Uncharacterized protein n=1 Tax=Streptomyces albipurpureus TaxID=2897419 RepID=A0ABT0ULT0_9ACTN|nr:hypothetical protein [Streptomyces sp. CWNU-1]MCM2389577.1 hypothetical protein [Streptomyces sp. CWNU-1]